MEDTTEQFSADEEGELGDDPLHYEDPVMHISGAGHWFLEGWIGDHSVEFLVDSGSSVTAISDVLYGNLLQAGAPVGALQATARTLHSANGTGIEVLGCSCCSVSFLGLRTEFPIIICSLPSLNGLRKTMVFHGKPWFSKENHGFETMVFHGKPWFSMFVKWHHGKKPWKVSKS